MRLSCNGCRVLRKGCSDDCTIRPCLQWIRNPQSQAYATLFLAKFYGRAGLINLIDAGPSHLRPAIFKSLLYEACGRIVNPIHGSVGLMCSGSWHLCQAAVEAVLKDKPITSISSDSESAFQACDIRHVSKDNKSSGKCSDKLRKVKSRNRCKRSGPKPHPNKLPEDFLGEFCVSKGPESEVSQHPSNGSDNGEGDSVSVETVEAKLIKADGSDVELDLTLCL